MVTFYDCLQEFYKKNPDRKLSKRSEKRLHRGLKNIYDSKETNGPVQYVTSIEHSGTFNVRAYPDKFKKTIDALINKYAPIIEYSKKQEIGCFIVHSEIGKPHIKERKKIKKPVFSAKK